MTCTFSVQDTLYIRVPKRGGIEEKHFEPLSVAFLVFFAMIILMQFISMLFHRYGTFLHILASTTLNCCSKKYEPIGVADIVQTVKVMQTLKGIADDDEVRRVASHTHTHVHARIHKHTHTHAQMYTPAHTNTRTHTQKDVHAHTNTHTHTHVKLSTFTSRHVTTQRERAASALYRGALHTGLNLSHGVSLRSNQDTENVDPCHQFFLTIRPDSKGF